MPPHEPFFHVLVRCSYKSCFYYILRVGLCFVVVLKCAAIFHYSTKIKIDLHQTASKLQNYICSKLPQNELLSFPNCYKTQFYLFQKLLQTDFGQSHLCMYVHVTLTTLTRDGGEAVRAPSKADIILKSRRQGWHQGNLIVCSQDAIQGLHLWAHLHG